MQPSHASPSFKYLDSLSFKGFRAWFAVSFGIVLAAGYFRFETNRGTLARGLVIALVLIIVARLAHHLWMINRLVDEEEPAQAEHDAFWARLREERWRTWNRFGARGRARHVWWTTLSLTPLLLASLFGLLVLVGPDHFQFGTNPPQPIGFWTALAVASLTSVSIAVVHGVRSWERAVRSWATPTESPPGERTVDGHYDPPA
jgi:hypothetical protein